MNRHKSLYALASVLLLSAALPGCVTFEKCGFGGCPGDAKITADVERRLQDTPTPLPNTIYVQTSNHEVYLSGLVDTRVEKAEAETIASQTPGVTHVLNSIVGHGP
jgi:osmotically-inducible protein OsmY